MRKLLFLILTVASSYSFASDLSSMFSCYKSLIAHAYGANYLLENGTILLPGESGSQKGFYLFSDRTAYFCSFPASPQKTSAQFNYYYLKVDVPGAASEYITYSDELKNKTNPGLGTSTAPAEALQGQFQNAKCGTNLTDDTRKLLADELKARVSSVYSTYLGHQDYMKKRFNRDEKPDGYKSALTSCSSVPALEADAQKELGKFPAQANAPGQAAPTGAVK